MLIVAFFTIAKIWKQPKCPSVHEWIKQLWDIYTMEYYSTIKKENFTFCKRMDGPGEYYAKWNKPVREKQIPYDFTHTWNLVNKLNYWTNEQNRKRLIDIRVTAIGGGRLEGKGIEQKGKRTHVHGQQCGDCREEGGIRKLNGNGKNTIHFFKKICEKIVWGVCILTLTKTEAAQHILESPLWEVSSGQ